MKVYYRTFLIFILSSIFFIFLVGKIRPKPISSTIDKEKFWADKVHSKKTYNVIFEGDSRFYRGVDPKSVSKELSGKDVLNFGFSSGGHNKIIFEAVNKRLSKSDETKVVVLGLTPYSLTPKAQENMHYLQEAQRPRDEVFRRRVLTPFLRFFDPVRPTEFIMLTDTVTGYHEKFRPDGWVESNKIPYNPEAALPGYVNDFKENIVSEKVIKEMLNQVEIWIKSDILVFGLRMPTTLKMEELENRLSGYRESDLKERFVNIGGYWIDLPDRDAYSSYDGSHLIDTSAMDFSKYVGQQIQKRIQKIRN